MKAHDKSARNGHTPALTLAALGIVYGDIGTSPLYTIKEIFAGSHHPVPITPDNILGILSLILWSLIVVIALKYVVFIMSADNKGEGGIMALMALVRRSTKNPAQAAFLMLLGLFGGALFYGDSVLTPAISVLSAIEGLNVATSVFEPYIVPISLGVLIGLFMVQKRGTARVGELFGPVMIVWFVTLAGLGVAAIVRAPQVLAAVNPHEAWLYFRANPGLGFLSLGAAVLALTGGEALYADMGHFGARPVRIAWFTLVLPALVLNYFGQGALLLVSPQAIQNPFYLLAPSWALYPMVVLATAATVIASQAVISGTFSITRQAIQLGYMPRVKVRHTSEEEIGQIYLPGVNWMLLAAVALLVVGFGSSSRLASAYGLAVTGTMLITTILAFVVVTRIWQASWLFTITVIGLFLAVDLAYFSANLVKIHEGGWFPLAVGVALFTVMTTWKRGRKLLYKRLAKETMSVSKFAEVIASSDAPVIPGTAVFLTPNADMVPRPLLFSIKHYKSLHARIVILVVEIQDEPHVPADQRIHVERLNDRLYRVRIHFGFMDETHLPQALRTCATQGLDLDLGETSFFLGRETLIPKFGSEMAFWREQLFIAMFRNAGSVAEQFRLPPDRVIELGAQVEL